MLKCKHLFVASIVLASAFAVATSAAKPKTPSEYEAIVQHLKTNYRAKKVKIPLLWLARFAVSVARPAGVKSFSVTLFKDLKFSRVTLDREMQAAMKHSFTNGWSSILRLRTAEGQQKYMYMREAGKSVKIALVTIDKDQAAIVRATFSPERLGEFINDPQVFGISMSEKKKPEAADTNAPEKKENNYREMTGEFK
ncbi:MAG: hypothetical protein ABI539_03470 [Acidobacteriota bacterium]